MSNRIAINGLGRIGRNVLRELGKRASDYPFEVVAINDLTDAKTLAHLLKYDSVHGRFSAELTHTDTELVLNHKPIKVLAEKDPLKLPWGTLEVDLVLECTGALNTREKAAKHLEAGAKTVIISAPADDADITTAYGVNHGDFNHERHHLISCASCTTNCLAPVAKVLLDSFGIVRGSMTTIHSFTNDQRILDLPHKDLRRARAATLSMIPTTTGAAKAVGLVLPGLKGKIDGLAIRVPTADVSVVDFVAELGRDVTVDQVNQALRKASETELAGVLGFSDQPLVSVDYVRDPRSSIVDAKLTMVVGSRLAKVISWYDNEIGFSNRMLDVSKLVLAS